MKTETVTIIAENALEMARLGAQIYFAASQAAHLTEAEMDILLAEQRNRFKKNIATPLPDP